jgi:hypothetical protein
MTNREKAMYIKEHLNDKGAGLGCFFISVIERSLHELSEQERIKEYSEIHKGDVSCSG